MPITKSATKSLRVSRRKKAVNNRTRIALTMAVKKALRKPTHENLEKAASSADRAARKKVIHTNKAARIKRRLSKKTPKKIAKKS